MTKPKKPRSEKQIEAFKIAMQKRAESVAKKKEDKLIQSAKLLIEKQQKVQVIEDATDSEPDTEPEPVKKSKTKKQIDIRPKAKSKPKKIIIESESESETSESESETDTSESSDSEPEFIIKSRKKTKPKPKKYETSRREPNTRVKRSEPVHNHPAKPNTDYTVYFV